LHVEEALLLPELVPLALHVPGIVHLRDVRLLRRLGCFLHGLTLLRNRGAGNRRTAKNKSLSSTKGRKAAPSAVPPLFPGPAKRADRAYSWGCKAHAQDAHTHRRRAAYCTWRGL